MLDSPEMNGQTRLPKPEQHSPLLMFPASGMQDIWGGDALSYVEHAKIFRSLPCENVVTATSFVCISI